MWQRIYSLLTVAHLASALLNFRYTNSTGLEAEVSSKVFKIILARLYPTENIESLMVTFNNGFLKFRKLCASSMMSSIPQNWHPIDFIACYMAETAQDIVLFRRVAFKFYQCPQDLLQLSVHCLIEDIWFRLTALVFLFEEKYCKYVKYMYRYYIIYITLLQLYILYAILVTLKSTPNTGINILTLNRNHYLDNIFKKLVLKNCFLNS